MKSFLISCLTQVTIVSVAATLLYSLASRRRPSVRAAVIGTALFAIAVLTPLSVCPLPSWWSLLPDVTSATEVGTSLAALGTPGEPSVWAAVDPFRIWFWVLVTIGLVVTRQLSRRMAVASCSVLYLLALGVRVGVEYAPK